MFDKYQLIDQIILKVDALADARGAQKCSLIIEVVQMLGTLRKGLKNEEEAANEPVVVAETSDNHD